MGLHVLVFLDALVIAVLSGSGTMTQPGIRRHIDAFAYARVVLVGVEIVFAIYGAVGLVASGVIFPSSSGCSASVRTVCVLGVALSFFLVPFTPLVLLCFFDPLLPFRPLLGPLS